jgi:hypothetical protein
MKVLFAGPSLSGDFHTLPERARSVVCAGPVARGGVAKSVLNGATAIGIVDGRFEDTLSVWHKEILFALSSGVAVAGAASMGALRAAECSAFGMIGIGTIFNRYASGELVDDSDVAQIHAPAELGYLPLSEPWVNIEPTLLKMASDGICDTEELAALTIAGRQLHYKERTYQNLFKAAPAISAERASQLLAWTSVNAVNQKRLDALELVDWLASCPIRRGAGPEWQFSDTSHWRALLNGLRDDDPFNPKENTGVDLHAGARRVEMRY